ICAQQPDKEMYSTPAVEIAVHFCFLDDQLISFSPKNYALPEDLLGTVHTCKFKGKVDEGFLVGYSVNSKAFRVFNNRTRIVQETLHVNFLENKPYVAGSGPTWLFNIDSLIRTMNYQPVIAGNQTNPSTGFQDKFDAKKAEEEIDQQYVLFPMWSSGSTNPQNNKDDAAFDDKEHDFDAKKPESEFIVSPSSSAQSRKQDDKTKKEAKGKSLVEYFTGYRDLTAKFEDCSDNSSNEVNAAGSIVPTVGQNFLNNTNTFSVAGPSNAAVSPTYGKSSFIDAFKLLDDPDMPELEDITYSDDEDVEEPKRVHQALKDQSWIEAMQEELLQFKMQKVWVLVDLPYGKRAIVKRIFRYLKGNQHLGLWYLNDSPLDLVVYSDSDYAGASLDRKSTTGGCQFLGCRLISWQCKKQTVVATSSTEAEYVAAAKLEDITYSDDEDDVGVEADFTNLETSITVRFEDPDHPDKVYKVVKVIYGLHQAPRAWYETLATYLLENGFQRGTIDQTLFFKKQKGDILLVQIYVFDIIFGATNKDLCKSFEKLMKDKFQMSFMGELTFFLGLQDPYGEDVDVHTYRSMIGSLMYLTSSRPDIMFAVCACARFQVTLKASHLYAVKRIFRYLKGKPHLGLWYLNDSPLDLVVYSDSDYAGASLDRKSTTGGCQFLGCRLISWQCKKQTVVATSSTEAEYVAAASCSKWNRVIKKDVTCFLYLKCWLSHLTTNGSQFTMSNPHKNRLVQKQTALGKDSSNPLMADNLPKIVWYSTHHVSLMKSWLVQKQTALGEESDQQYVLFPVWSSSSTNPHNTDGDAAFDEKEPEFEGRKPESEFIVSLISSAHINEDNAAGSLVFAIGQFSPNNTNTFSVAGLSNAVASPTHGKSSCIDTSQYPDDPDMPELEDITYSDDDNDDDDVGAEDDFNNLETSTIVSPIPTTRVHKDHLVTQIIGDLSSATQTRSMIRVAKDQEEEGFDYEEVFAPLARIEAIRLFLAYASFMGFMVYQIDVKSAFIYGTIKEEVYVCQHLGFKDLDHPDKVYKVVKILYGLHQAPRVCQDKYVAEILRKFGLTDGKSASTPIDTEKPLLKDLDGEDVDVHTYRSMIGSLMYLTSSRPDIMFVIYACAHFQVTPKASHLHTVKRIFRYLKGKPHLGLWYPKDSPFDLVAYSDSDYAGASIDRKSTTGRCQFLGCRLISWQCKKQTVMATSSTEAEYVAAISCCTQVLWIQNQLLDYGSIKYALTVNPNMYVSCIKQFWTTVAVKKVNGVMRLQALVDKKKVVVLEATIRDTLGLDDVDGVECLPNEEIFTELARIGYEKPSTKLTFYKAFFSSQWKFLIHTILLVRNVDSLNKVYMYPRFLQLMIRKQVGDFSTHTTKYTSPALTQKVFANMRRVEPSIPSPTPPTPPLQPSQDIPSTSQVQPTPPQSPRAQQPTPQQQPQPSQDAGISMNLFQDLMDTCTTLTRRVEHLKLDKVAQAMEITKLKQRVKKLEKKNKGRMIAEMDEDADVVLEEAKDVDADIVKDVQDADVEANVVTTTKIINEVVTTASETITIASINITTTDAQVPAAITTAAPSILTAAPRRRKGVMIRDLKESITTSIIIHAKTKSKDKGKGILVEEPKPHKKQAQIEQDEQYARELEADLNRNIDWDEVIDHVNKKAKEDPIVKRYQALKRKLQTEAQAKKNMMIYLKNVVGFKMDYFKGMSYDDIRHIFEAKFNSNVAFLQKTKEQIDEEESRALKRINETLAEKATKRQKLDEEVPVVDYDIYNQNNKPYYKIKRADGTHQLYLSFLSLLRNFDREDLEALWRLVKERFATTKPNNFSDDFLLITLGAIEDLETLWKLVKDRFESTEPKNFSDDFLLNTFKIMFEKPNVEANVWRDQKGRYGLDNIKTLELMLLKTSRVYAKGLLLLVEELVLRVHIDAVREK
nr:hypothetical protein [Tanacetum cinerariifolium]